MEEKMYIIYMPKVAAALRELGFKIEKVSPNRHKPQYDVYWFIDTPSFREAIPKAVEMAKK